MKERLTFEKRRELKEKVSDATALKLINDGKRERKDLLLLGRQFSEQGRHE